MNPSEFPSSFSLLVTAEGQFELLAAQRYLLGLGYRWFPASRSADLQRSSSRTDTFAFLVNHPADHASAYLHWPVTPHHDVPTVQADALIESGLKTVVEHRYDPKPLWEGTFGGFHAALDSLDSDIQVYSSADMNHKEFVVETDTIEEIAKLLRQVRQNRPPGRTANATRSGKHTEVQGPPPPTKR